MSPIGSSEGIVLEAAAVSLNTSLPLLKLGASFVDNGGDSLSSISFQTTLRKQGIYISLHSIFQAKTLLSLTKCNNKQATNSPVGLLLSSVPQGFKRSFPEPAPSPKCVLRRTTSTKASMERHPMTEMQLSLIHSSQINAERNMILCSEKHRPENIGALKKAWRKVLELEPIFRMTFEAESLHGYMKEQDGMPFVWEEVVVEDESSYQLQVESPSVRTTAPVGNGFRVIILQPGLGHEGEATVVWKVHHAMIDGMSYVLVRSKVRRVLAGEQVYGGPSFKHFVTQLLSLQRQNHESATVYWLNQTKKYGSTFTELSLPSFVMGTSTSAAISTYAQIYTHSDSKRLVTYAREAGVTVASLYYAAWGLVLARYADSASVCFGAVLSGHTLPIDGVQTTVGPTINTLPFFLSLEEHSTIAEYTQHTFNTLLELISLQWSNPSHGFTRKFSSAVNIQLEGSEAFEAPFDPLERPTIKVFSDFPIQVDVEASGRIGLSYDTGLFPRSLMQNLGEMFGAALEGMLSPGVSIASQLESLVGPEQLQGLGNMGNWASPLPRHRSFDDDLLSLFARSVQEYPAAVAVEYSGGRLTYGELDNRTSMTARQLSRSLAPGEVVAVCADGTVDWIVAIYATLKAGAIYCPFDKSLPDSMRAANFTASNAKIFLAGTSADKSFGPASCGLCLSVEELLKEDRTVAQNTEPGTLPKVPYAYLCFTSGSTGKPKGVLCSHEGLVAFQKDFQVRLHARPGWKIAQFMSPGFDGSIHEIFSALSYGSTLVLKDESKPFEVLKRCDAAILTPSVAQALDPADYPNLQCVYLVGEAVPQRVCDTWGVGRKLFNMYGPTEATCGSTTKILIPGKPVTLGRPNASMRLYIIDSRRRVVPRGAVGEIYLAGVQIAGGYVNQADETARRFLPDSIHPQYENERMYQTGDRGYWNEEGELVFVGRVDRQVKLRGFRIDLDDLEFQMVRACSSCTAIVVTPASNVDGNDHCLVAAVQPANLDVHTFRLRLRQEIPPWALPRYIVAMETFPMTAAGKVNYTAIAAMGGGMSDSFRTTPENIDSKKQLVLEAIRDVLRVPRAATVSLESRFSDLGGTSMLAILLSHRLSRSFNQPVSIGLILQSATIFDLVIELAALKEDPRVSHVNESFLDNYSVAPIEIDWWHKYQRNAGTSSFNVTYACTLSEVVDVERLTSAWNFILRRHRILRCRYQRHESGRLVRVYSKTPPIAKQFDKDFNLHREINIPFELGCDESASGDLVRVFLSREHMLVVISHIICDLTALRTLLREVAEVYHGRDLAPLARSYSQAINNRYNAASRLSFWSDYLEGAPRAVYASVGRGLRRCRKAWTGSSYIRQVPAGVIRSLHRFVSAHAATIHQLALAAVALALQYDMESCDITLGAPYLGRDSEEDLDVVGLFLEPLPIRIRYPPPPMLGSWGNTKSDDSNSLIKEVQRSSKAALSAVVPWEQLLAHLGIERRLLDAPLFDVMVTYHEHTHDVRFPVPGAKFVPTWSEGAKFKLMAEFTERSNGDLDLRLEYSDECFTRRDIVDVSRIVVEALTALADGHSYDVIRNTLKHIADNRC